MKTLDELSYAQKERLAFIDFSLSYFGEITRLDLIHRFQTGLAAATRDFATYKALAPYNLVLNHQSKSYHRTELFNPLFEHQPEQVLSSLVNGFGDGLSTQIPPSQSCIEAQQLNKPATKILSAVMRAITQKQMLNICYVSLSSGQCRREIVPHSLANNGCRWHIRAYDRLTSSFRDFVITRIKSAVLVDGPIRQENETVASDKQWNRIVELTLKPHPQAAYPEAIELDYAMTDGKLAVECRAALAGYLLNQWHVDCSRAHRLNARQYPLILRDKAALFGVESAYLAPGYDERVDE